MPAPHFATARKARVDYLVSLDRRHMIEIREQVYAALGLRILLPAELLDELRRRWIGYLPDPREKVIFSSILNPQSERPISYPAYRYFSRQDPELPDLWQSQRPYSISACCHSTVLSLGPVWRGGNRWPH